MRPTGQAEERVSWNVGVVPELSADLTGSSGTGLVLQSCTELPQRG